MVSDELDASGEVRLIELIGNIPAEGTVLPALLHCGV